MPKNYLAWSHDEFFYAGSFDDNPSVNSFSDSGSSYSKNHPLNDSDIEFMDSFGY